MKKIIVAVFSFVALLALAPSVYAYDLFIGNTANSRPVVDTYQNFSIVDINNPASFDGIITQFEYWASNTNPFKLLIVDGDKKVQWKSELITPTAVGLNTYTPTTEPEVKNGWNVGLYFQSTGTVPFEYDSSASPAYYEPDNAGEPEVGDILSTAGTTERYYSFLASGWKVLTTPEILGFLSPTLSCGALTNIHSTTVDWTDSTGGVGGVEGYEYAIDYPLVGGGTGHWTTFLVPSQRSGALNEGLHTIQVRAKDSTGNYSAWSNSCSITTDWTAPDVEINSPTNNSVVSGIIDIRGSVEDVNPHHYWFVIEDSSNNQVAGPGVVNETNSFTNQLLLTWDTTLVPDGEYTIKLEARDAANNKDSGSVDWHTITVDNTPPLVKISSPNDDSVISGLVDITGSVTDNFKLSHYNLSLYPGDVDLSDGDTHSGDRLNNSDWCTTPTSGTVYLSANFTGNLCTGWDTTRFSDGDYQIRLAARDAAGNRDLSDPYNGNTSSVHVIGITIDNAQEAEGRGCHFERQSKPRWNCGQAVLKIFDGKGEIVLDITGIFSGEWEITNNFKWKIIEIYQGRNADGKRILVTINHKNGKVNAFGRDVWFIGSLVK